MSDSIENFLFLMNQFTFLFHSNLTYIFVGFHRIIWVDSIMRKNLLLIFFAHFLNLPIIFIEFKIMISTSANLPLIFQMNPIFSSNLNFPLNRWWPDSKGTTGYPIHLSNFPTSFTNSQIVQIVLNFITCRFHFITLNFEVAKFKNYFDWVINWVLWESFIIRCCFY